MKKLYYFSKSKLQFVEIKNYKSKLSVFISGSVLGLSALILGGYFLVASFTSSSKSFSALKTENEILKSKLVEIADLYGNLNNQLDSLSEVNNNLRVAANLPPISDEERKVGIGGGSFDNTLDFLTGDTENKLKDALSLIDEVSRKVDFEKNEYTKISKKLKENKKLFASIPAIKPCSGIINDEFGMRMHPILHIRRMHDGIDIVADMGSEVHATGNGKVDFVGRRGGYGLCIEVDHGFGYRTIYAHLSAAEVKKGQKVNRGDDIARTGTSGLSTGPHLHYEVEHDGVKLNPEDFFFDDLAYFDLTNKN